MITSTQWLGDALEVRFFNPTTVETTATLHLSKSAGFTQWEQVDLESNAIGGATPIADNTVFLAVGAKKIGTLRLTRGN